MEDENLTDEEVMQIGTVNYAAYQAVCDVLHADPATEEIPWDMEWIGEVSDVLVDAICKQLGKSEQEIYPSIERS